MNDPRRRRSEPAGDQHGVDWTRLVVTLVAIAGVALLAAVVAASTPVVAALTVVGAGLVAVAATEVG